MLYLICAFYTNTLVAQDDRYQGEQLDINTRFWTQMSESKTVGNLQFTNTGDIDYRFDEDLDNILKIERSSNSTSISSVDDQGQELWSKNYESAGRILTFKTSDNFKRTFVYAFENEDKWIHQILDENGDVIASDIEDFELSPTGNFIYRDNSLMLMNSDLNEIDHSFIQSIIKFDSNNEYRFNSEVIEKDVLKLSVTSFKQDGSSRRRGEVLSSKIYLIDLINEEAIFEFDLFNDDGTVKRTFGFVYSDGNVIATYINRNLSSPGNDSEMIIEAINVETGISKVIGNGSYLYINEAKTSGALFFAQRNNGNIELNYLFPSSELNLQKISLAAYRRVEDIFTENESIFIKSQAFTTPFQTADRIERVNSTGVLETELVGWTGRGKSGLYPITDSKLIINRK